MTDTLGRLAGPVAGTGADAVLYTVPAATKASIRGIRIVNNHATAVKVCKMSIGADGAGTRVLPAGMEIPPKAVYSDPDLIVLNAAEVLHWTGDTDLTVTISGVAVT